MKKNINEKINAEKVYVIDELWEITWPTDIREAIKKAESIKKDLVEVWLREWVIVTKIMDYWKHAFKEQKKNSKNRTKSKKAEPKTLRITYAMSLHDLTVRANQAIKFAWKGHPLKVTLMLKRRENQHSDVWKSQVEKFSKMISEFYEPEGILSKMWNTFSLSFKVALKNLKKH